LGQCCSGRRERSSASWWPGDRAGRLGLVPSGWLPSGVAVPGFPLLRLGQAGCCRCGLHGGVGSSLSPIHWWVRVTPFPSPCSLSEPASSDHHRGGVVAAGIRRTVTERFEPMFGTPAAGVGRVNGDHRESGVGSHLGQAVAELGGRDTGDEPPERTPTTTPRGASPAVFTADGSGFGEVEVLDHDRAGAVTVGERQQFGHGLTQPPVSCRRRQPGQVNGHCHGCTDRVA
jgi:hypothetical protein